VGSAKRIALIWTFVLLCIVPAGTHREVRGGPVAALGVLEGWGQVSGLSWASIEEAGDGHGQEEDADASTAGSCAAAPAEGRSQRDGAAAGHGTQYGAAVPRGAVQGGAAGRRAGCAPDAGGAQGCAVGPASAGGAPAAATQLAGGLQRQAQDAGGKGSGAACGLRPAAPGGAGVLRVVLGGQAAVSDDAPSPRRTGAAGGDPGGDGARRDRAGGLRLRGPADGPWDDGAAQGVVFRDGAGVQPAHGGAGGVRPEDRDVAEAARGGVRGAGRGAADGGAGQPEGGGDPSGVHGGRPQRAESQLSGVGAALWVPGGPHAALCAGQEGQGGGGGQIRQGQLLRGARGRRCGAGAQGACDVGAASGRAAGAWDHAQAAAGAVRGGGAVLSGPLAQGGLGASDVAPGDGASRRTHRAGQAAVFGPLEVHRPVGVGPALDSYQSINDLFI